MIAGSRHLLAFCSAATAAVLLGALPVTGQLAEPSRPPLGVPLGTPVEGGAAPPRAGGGLLPVESEFAASQLRHDRVLAARTEARFAIKQLFREAGIRYPAAQIYMRIFKRERILELWVKPMDGDTFALLKTYDICALAGELGPKRRQGDNQVPEGFYYVDWFNPQSDFLLSLHVDYPNLSDRALGDTGNLGGDIFIHGGCNSEGCLAVTDENIKELYWIAVEARGAGQGRIPVHIFPARLNDLDMPRLASAFATRPAHVALWRSMKPGFDFFERERRVPFMSVAQGGYYQLAGEDRGQSAPPPRLARQPAGQPLGQPLGEPVEAGGSPAPAEKPLGSPVRPASGSTEPLGKPAG
ncbi:MAG TPA: L,D-transpeptidase family protein [Longimicrobiales bacterium]|nr:L,D-transpeptidase family protein [Longimicrobiales bacterium]